VFEDSTQKNRILQVIIEQFDLRLSCIVVKSEESPLETREDSTNCVAVSIDHHRIWFIDVAIDSLYRLQLM